MLYTILSLAVFVLAVSAFAVSLNIIYRRAKEKQDTLPHRLFIEVDNETENLDIVVDEMLKSFEKRFDETLEITLVKNNAGEELEKLCEILSKKFDTVDAIDVAELTDAFDSQFS